MLRASLRTVGPMQAFSQFFLLSLPLFALVFVGYAVACWRYWRREYTAFAGRFVFAVALPALLFRMMMQLAHLPPVDARLLIAFFGGCLLVFFVGRALAASVFRLDGVSQSVFALGGVFSNNVLLGLPLAKITLGERAVPSVALVLVFNALSLWTLVTLSVEWSRHGSLSLRGFGRTAIGVLKNPLIIALLLGVACSFAEVQLPQALDDVLEAVGHVAAPAALFVLGIGLADYGLRAGWQQSVVICALKLVMMPAVVWLLCALLQLPTLETKVVVLLSSMAVGVNVYLMAAQFDRLQSTIASSLVLSTVLAAVTTPLVMAVLTLALG